MPSPIAHLAAGYAIYSLSRTLSPQGELRQVGPFPGLLVFTAGLSLLPDIDSIAGLLTGDFGRFHNNLTHSLLLGLGIAFTIGVLMHWRRGSGFWYWMTLAGLCYDLHVVMDWTTDGRGVMALWPITAQRFLAPVTLFYGLHWSDGLFSERHLITLATELGFVALVLFVLHGIWPRLIRGRT
jgi:membrane-bound metal-dependent hydrolase YbcI (DUF457 family)